MQERWPREGIETKGVELKGKECVGLYGTLVYAEKRRMTLAITVEFIRCKLEGLEIVYAYRVELRR